MNVAQVGKLLRELKLKRYVKDFKKREVDGRKLACCRTFEDVKEFGIDINAEAIVLFNEIIKSKQETGKTYHNYKFLLSKCYNGDIDLKYHSVNI